MVVKSMDGEVVRSAQYLQEECLTAVLTEPTLLVYFRACFKTESRSPEMVKSAVSTMYCCYLVLLSLEASLEYKLQVLSTSVELVQSQHVVVVCIFRIKPKPNQLSSCISKHVFPL